MPDPFEQLAEIDIPPPPDQFDRSVHRRLNQALIVVHFVEFAFRAVPFGIKTFARVLWAFGRFTLSGRFDDGRRRPRR
jgi:hypothetical protein